MSSVISPFSADEFYQGLEQSITERLVDFDLLALLQLLKFHGFNEDCVWFCSHASLASQDRLIQKIKIDPSRVVLTINLGFLSATGIIPNYIRAFYEKPEVDDLQLHQFIGFFDHVLILNYLVNIYPQLNRWYFSDWPTIKKQLLQLQNVKSPSSLYWLLECSFSECEITLTEDCSTKDINEQVPVLGELKLVSATIKTRAKQYGWKVILTTPLETEESFTQLLEDYQLRLEELVLPWLRHTHIQLQVYLVKPIVSRAMRLHKNSLLGFSSFKEYTRSVHAEGDDIECVLMPFDIPKGIGAPTAQYDDMQQRGGAPWLLSV